MRWRRSDIDFNRCNNRQATRMACPDLETGQETSAFEALESTRKWKIDSGDLLLFDTHDVLARFSREKSDAGTTWLKKGE